MNKTFTWTMRNRENVKVLISETRRSAIDERELFSRRKEEIQRQREERQEETFEKRAVFPLSTMACGNRLECAN